MHKLHNLTVVDYEPSKRIVDKVFPRSFLIKKKPQNKDTNVKYQKLSNSIEIEPWASEP
jgi:hypothetical protein